MIRAISSDATAPAEIDLDEYTPLTITWPGATRLLDPPVYGRVRDSVDGLLELKFDPSTARLIEAVLVNAPRVSFSDEARVSSQHSRTQVAIVLDGTSFDSGQDLGVTAYADVLLVTWSPARVVDFAVYGGVIFGLDTNEVVSAFGFEWWPGQRDKFASLWQRAEPSDT